MPNNRRRCTRRANRRDGIADLKKQAEQLTGGRMTASVSRECPPEIEEQFWRHVVAFEQADPVVLSDLLQQRGVVLPAPDELDDAQLTDKLWEVIHALAELGTFLHSTDHLSDRDLYAYLWRESLREPTVVMPDNPDFAYHIDIIGSGSDEDNFLWLKHYADEETRRRWAADWPGDPLPEHEPPPFDRDRHLPQRP